MAVLALSLGLSGCGDDGGTGGPMAGWDAGPPPGDGGAMPGEDAGPTGGEDAGPTGGDDAGPGGDDAGTGCPTGYRGEDCTDCADGYVSWGGSADCLPSCELTTGPEAFTCDGIGQECRISFAEGTRYCACLDGYEGDDCGTCSEGWHRAGSTCQLDPPTGLSLVLWLDADEPGTMDLDADMELIEWRDRRGLGGVSAVATTGIARPDYLPEGRNGRGALEFDGTDDQLVVNGFDMLGSQDFEVIVAGEPTGDTPNGIFGALTGTSGWAFMLERHDSTDFRAIYRKTPGTSGGETITLERSAPAGPMYVSASHLTSSSIDTLAMWAANGTDDDALNILAVTPSTPMASPINLRIGRTQNGRMDGRIYEVLVYSRRLTVAQREAVFLYLREKWNLP